MTNLNIHEQTPELTQILLDYLQKIVESEMPKYQQVSFDVIQSSIFLSWN